jgi:hypothetical protein
MIETKLKGCNRGVTVTANLSTVFTTASHNAAYGIVSEASPRPALLQDVRALHTRSATAHSL